MEDTKISISHPDSYNTGNKFNPVISYEEYQKKQEEIENADSESSDNT